MILRIVIIAFISGFALSAIAAANSGNGQDKSVVRMQVDPHVIPFNPEKYKPKPKQDAPAVAPVAAPAAAVPEKDAMNAKAAQDAKDAKSVAPAAQSAAQPAAQSAPAPAKPVEQPAAAPVVAEKPAPAPAPKPEAKPAPVPKPEAKPAPAPKPAPAKAAAPAPKPAAAPVEKAAPKPVVKPVAPSAPAQPGVITEFSAASVDKVVELFLATKTKPGKYNIFTLKEPARLVVDIDGAWELKGPNVFRTESGLVKHVVVGVHKDKIRFVVHFRDPAALPQKKPVLKYADGEIVVQIGM